MTLIGKRDIRTTWLEYGRGVCGGLLFSLPLLYTMEVWFGGTTASPAHLLIIPAVTLALLLAFNHFAGLRYDYNRVEVFIDSIEEFGLGIIVSTVVLLVIGQIGTHTSTLDAVGKIVLQAMTVAIGISIGSKQLGTGGGSGGDCNDEGTGGDSAGKENHENPAHPKHFVAALCGAVIVASNVAPTEEITLIAVGAGPLRLIAIVLFSLLCLVLLFSVFAARKELDAPATELFKGVIMDYFAAIFVSSLLLMIYGHFSGVSPAVAISEIVVLAFVASFGAGAGRFLLR